MLVFPLVLAACRRDGERAVPPALPSRDVAPAPAEPDPRPIAAAAGRGITLVYSSNVRGQYEPWGRPAHAQGGLARRAALVEAIRKQTRTIVQVDAGDLLLPPRGQLVYLDDDAAERERRAAFIMAAYARLGVQAVVPGETDLALGSRRLVRLAVESGVPFLCANLVDAEGKPIFPAERLLDAGGVSIGVFGLLVPPASDVERLRSDGLRIADPAVAGKMAVASLRTRGATVVIGLFHLEGGLEQARGLAAAIGGIDVVVLGHDGATIEMPAIGGGARIVEAGVDGKRLGRFDLSTARNQIDRIDGSAGETAALAASLGKQSRERQRRAADGLLAAVDPRLANVDKPQPRTRGGAPQPPLRENWTYSSTTACAGCHADEDKQWRETSHAFALATLESKGRDKDPDCLPCHTTAFLRPGGTRSLATTMKYFPEVGCESCHGPSAAHVQVARKTGTQRAVPETMCRICHPRESTSDFDYARDLRGTLGPGHGL